MSPDPFDELDRELARGLSRLAPEVGGGDETLASMRPRFQRARTRARIVRVSAGLASLLAIGTIATLAAPSRERSHVSVNAPSSTPATQRRVPPSTRHTSTTTVPATRASTTTSTVTTPTTGGSGPSSPSGPTPTTAAVPVPVTSPDAHGGPGPSGGGSDGGHGHGGSSTSTTVPSQSGTRTYHSSGGDITVRFSHGALSLIHVSPASGCSSDIRDRGPYHVEVRFRRGGQEQSRIELQVENGRIVRTDHSNG